VVDVIPRGAVRDAYVRGVDVVRVIDGDTFIADVDLGFYVRVRMSCRLLGINAPDRGEGGREEAREALGELLAQGPVSVESVRADKFAGRFDAVVFVTVGPDVVVVNDALVKLGVAVRWDGTGRRPVVPWPPSAPT
jgi:endonuclease YncB( thermonuclease family)